LRIEVPYGTSETAVRTQGWTAFTAYVLVALVRKRLRLALPLYATLPILAEGRVSPLAA